MKYTDLIPNLWYIGKSNKEKYLLKFDSLIFDESQIKILKTVCLNSDQKYSDASFSTGLEIERLATNSEILKYYPDEQLIQEDYEIY